MATYAELRLAEEIKSLTLKLQQSELLINDLHVAYRIRDTEANKTQQKLSNIENKWDEMKQIMKRQVYDK